VIRPFTAGDVPAAADLLVRRHGEHRRTQPLLAPLSLAAAAAAVTALLETDGAAGAVAERAGDVVGYLIGTPRDGASWGVSTWVQPAGCAGDRVAELWAHQAAEWLAAGRRAQYAVVPPALAPTFSRLGFGIQHVHAAMPVPAAEPHPAVRRAERRDVPDLARLDLVLDEHLVASPVFSAAAVTPYDEALQAWEKDVDDAGYATFVAERDGRVVGSAVGCDIGRSSGNSGLIAPERAALLGFVAVLPEARGLGLGRALAGAVHAWARAEAYDVICTDWRSANLTAARTWPALGYQETFLRMHRHVGY
jgi:GNAT superfamily N-acetyltransferase